MHTVKKIGRILLYTVGGLVGFVLLVVIGLAIALQMSSVQTWATGKAAGWLKGKIGTEVQVARVDIDLIKTIVIEGVYVEDKSRDTLLYAGKLSVDIGLFAFAKKEVNLNSVTLEHTVAKLRKPASKDEFNFQFIVDAFASKDTTPEPADTSKGWTIDAEKLVLNDIHFLLDNKFEGSELQAEIGNSEIDLKTLDLNGRHPQITAFNLKGARVRFISPAPDTAQITDSVVVKTKEMADPGKPKVLNESGWNLSLAHVKLSDIGIIYEVKNTPRQNRGFDYKHIDAQGLTLELHKIEVRSNDVLATLDHLSFTEKNSGLTLQNLALAAEIHAPFYQVRLKELRTPRTALAGGITAGIRNLEDTAGILNQLYVKGNFRHDSVHAADVAYFVPFLDSVTYAKLALKLDGGLRMDGTTVRARNLSLALNPANFVRLDGLAENVTDVAKLRVQELKHDIALDPRFADDFLPKNSLPAQAYQVGSLRLQGQMSGTLGGLTGRMELDSRPGKLLLERYYYRTNPDFSSHEGSAKLVTHNFRPAVVLGPGLGLGPVSLSADVAGGYSSKAGASLRKGEVVVQQAVYKRYAYRNARLSATYLQNIAHAHLQYADRNLKTDLHAMANMRAKTPVFTADGPLYANPHNLHFTKDTLIVSTRLAARVQGSNLTTMQARASLLQTWMQTPGRRVGLDTLEVRLATDSGQRLVEIRSEVLKARMAGHFDLATVGDALSNFAMRYIPLTGYKPKRNLPPQQFKLAIAIPAKPKALEAVVPGLRIPQPIALDMDFDTKKDILNTNLSVPYLRYQKNMLSGLKLTTLSKSDNWNVDLASETIAADSFIVPKPEVHLSIKENDARFKLRIASDEADNRVRLEGRILGVGDINTLTLGNSELFLKGQQWILDKNAKFEVGANHLLVSSFDLDNKEDSSKGLDIESPGGKLNALQVRLHNLEISDITRLIPPLGYDLGGLINVRADIDNVFTLAGLKANIKIDSLAVNKQQAGTLTVDAEQPAQNVVALKAVLSNLGADLKLAGQYNMVDTTRALDFRLTMDHYQPEKLAPVLHNFVTRWEGDLSADIGIKGSVSTPVIAGFLAFNGKNTLQPTFTQIPYQINDQRINIANRRVQLDHFTLLDEAGKQLTVDGVVNIAYPAEPSLDLKVKADNFHLINTRATDNESFYGTAFITTNLSLKGPASGLAIDGQVETEQGTRITYNLQSSEPGKAGKADFIHFVDSKDSSSYKKLEVAEAQKADLTGLGLSMRIRLKKGTRFLVLVDPATGDKLECEGTADLRFSMRPTGDINLQGDYNLTSGFYSLNLLGIVSRKFNVRNGSTLSWSGDPADAAVNLDAIYTTKVSRYELVADQEDAMSPAEVAAAKRRSPVSVILKITNTLMQPDIKFDIEVPETNSDASGGATGGIVSARIEQIRSNENELNKQALGLIALNRFVATGENGGGGGQTTTEQAEDKANQTVSDVLSSHLSALGEEFLGGVEINVNLAQQQSPDGTTSTGFADKEVGVSVGKSFANDRLHVTVGGVVNTGSTPAANGSSGSSAPSLGDVTAEYRLDKKGELNAKFFRTYNQNLYSSASTERIGTSLAHNKNFSSFRRLFWSKKRTQEYRDQMRRERDKNRAMNN